MKVHSHQNDTHLHRGKCKKAQKNEPMPARRVRMRSNWNVCCGRNAVHGTHEHLSDMHTTICYRYKMAMTGRCFARRTKHITRRPMHMYDSALLCACTSWSRHKKNCKRSFWHFHSANIVCFMRTEFRFNALRTGRTRQILRCSMKRPPRLSKFASVSRCVAVTCVFVFGSFVALYLHGLVWLCARRTAFVVWYRCRNKQKSRAVAMDFTNYDMRLVLCELWWRNDPGGRLRRNHVNQ